MLKKLMKSIIREMLRKYEVYKSNRLLTEILGYKPVGAYPDFLIKSISYIQSLQLIDDFKLSYTNGEWICHVEGLEFSLNSSEELLILKEIFIEGIYNIEINQPFTFIDIGMNVGMTSLFFAKKNECIKVEAFEPFQSTLSLAKKNLVRNKIAQKIHVNEIGLGYPTRTIKINYSEEFKGSVGIGGVASYIVGNKDYKEEQLQITDVFEALNGIAEGKIIVKIDCEGSEYEILERLNDTGLLSRFDIIMIEWHIKGPGSLQKILIENKFEILSMGKHNLTIGMLYAFKK